ncbi:hypothetical protein SCHPADRAFT_913688 [Schizopora paradoxa]|uniref:CENP-V/GFA domain-containing protein n=1 Tax=Schizopora paradoxa TaxID=27342 RepID=A0A0H2S091_9AGAM|nr:hypothetical protein SCHPADRAFT_913688 [Schizopora paradoxa]
MSKYTGGCYCRAVRYEINRKEGDGSMSIRHCQNCKKFTGSENGITTKVPKDAFTVTKGHTKVHEGDNGSGTNLIREFSVCTRYVFYGEFFCSQRAQWMPEVPGVFHKDKVKD